MANEISKSLIIGIGGTGQNILIALKKRLYQRFGTIPDLIKLISIDADIINEKDDNFSFEYQGKIIEKEIRIDESEQYYFGRVNMKDQLEDGIYFDTTRIKDYGKLAGKKKRSLKAKVMNTNSYTKRLT